MNASKDPQSDAGASRTTGFLGLRFGAAILAAVGAGVLVPSAPAQTTLTITVKVDTGGAVVSARVAVPDPLAAAGMPLPCGDASLRCVQDVLDAVAPVLEPSPSPPARARPPEPEAAPDASTPKEGSRARPSPSADRAVRTPRKRSPAPERASLASRPELAELTTSSSSPGVQAREALPPRAMPENPPPRGPDLLKSSTPTPILPSALPGLEWSPLLRDVFLAAGSLALFLFVLVATPQHSLGYVSWRLADRRSDLGLLGAVLLVGLAVGYFVATRLG